MTVGFDDVLDAQRRIAPVVARTRLERSRNAIRHGCGSLHLKMETMQATGAFKVRGAANAILSLDERAKARGVVTASSGNHGRAIAHVAAVMGIPSAVCLSDLVPAAKVEAVKSTGAEVITGGVDQNAAIARARRIEAEQGRVYIDPFDDPHVIAGQGTIGLELLQDEPGLDVIIVQVSGGGLASGIALAAKTIKPDIRIIGVSMERGAAMHASLRAGKPIDVEELRTQADALQGGIGVDNRHTFNLCRRYLDDFILLSEDDITRAMCTAFQDEGVMLEGAGACGFGALARRKGEFSNANVAIICSGNNIDCAAFEAVIARCGELG